MTDEATKTKITPEMHAALKARHQVPITTHSCGRCGGAVTLYSTADYTCCNCEAGECDEEDDGHCDHAWHAGEGDKAICNACGATARIECDGETAWPVWLDEEAEAAK